jgi:dolichol-phosphate mannosyltransferase
MQSSFFNNDFFNCPKKQYHRTKPALFRLIIFFDFLESNIQGIRSIAIKHFYYFSANISFYIEMLSPSIMVKCRESTQTINRTPLLKKKQSTIIIPTYNEKKTISQLLEHLFDITFPLLVSWKMSVVVVDGNSPDGTARDVKNLQDRYTNLHLIVEKEKEGLGAAYFKGFNYAVSRLDTDVLIEFDGDLQHPPAAIPLLLEAIEKGADLVLGSRNIRGGTFPAQWDIKRLLLSKAGGVLARLILFFPTVYFFRITDPTTGLKATRTGEAYHRLNFDQFISKDFGYKLEMLFYLTRQNISVSEIPLQFSPRSAGQSKLTDGTSWKILTGIIKLRITYRQ